MNNEILITNKDCDKLLRAHDGDCALLLLWHAATGSSDLEQAAGDLCMTLSQVRDASEKLGRMKLSSPARITESSAVSAPSVPASAVPSAAAPSPAASSASAPAPERQQKKELSPPSDELPEYTAEEIESCTRSDSGFKAVLDAAKQILGKQLARHDMSRLLGIYNHLGLSAEVIYVLLHYCAELYRGPEGAERRPTIRAIEREAFIWANRGIHTPEEAEAYVEAQKALHSSFGQIKNALEIYDRKLISSEEAYFSSWLQMGFEVDAIRLAYERTIRNTGKRALPYMNTILSRWHESGLHTAEAIEKQDPEAGRKPSSSSSGARNKPLRPFTPTDFGDLS